MCILAATEVFICPPDEDVSHIFASLTESELERELQIAAR